MHKAQQKILPNGCTLSYSKFGIGPCVIFLHGYPENHLVWLPLMEKMAHQFSVLAFDWPGMGDSDIWNGGATPKVMSSRIIDIMDAFSLEKVHLVGHDMGGQPSLVCAAEFPLRILSVTVMNSLLIHDAKTSWEIKYLRNLSLNRFFLTHFPRLVFNRALGTFKSKLGALNNELKNNFWLHFRKKEVRNYIIRMCFGYQAQLPKLPRYYAKITCPTLVIWSTENKHFDIDHAHRLLEIVPHASLKTIAAASHWLGLTHTEKTAQLISHFIRQHN